LSLAFQPIVSLETGAVVAFEALGRPKRDFDSVADLFAVAERERSVPSLDRFAHSLAVASAEYLVGESRLFINASPVTMASPGFADRLGRLAGHAGFPVERVVVELTESEGEDEHDGVAASVDRLRALGFGFAIDDVGIGRSDLNRILKYRPNWIKLDRSLVQSLTADPYSRSLVRALARFAAERSIGLIAEGIELPWQARAVAELGITLAQGYWFAWPLALGEAASTKCPQRVERRWRAANLAA
jgi:EAL domain-containing protein (putative c-di-GMP-specific phosphodiesterase class I)